MRLVVSLTWLVATIISAHAHATLVSSAPADGGMLASPPTQLTLTFNEPVAPLVLRLIDPQGRATALTDVVGRGEALVVSPLPALATGTHVLSWRVVSLDGHPVGGSLVFSIGAPSANPPQVAAGMAEPLVAGLLWVARIVVYVGLLIGVGGAFFSAWIAAPGVRSATTVIVAALVAGLVALALSVGLQGADALELPLSALAQKMAWQAGLSTSYGFTAVVAAFALLAGIIACEVEQCAAARALSLFALLGVGLALALSGHASAAAPQALMRPAVGLHAISVAFWVGSLTPLAVTLCRDDSGKRDTLMRFSRAIPFALLALAASGATLAVVQIEAPGALLSTLYGRIFVAKMILVAVALAIAAWNRLWLTPRIVAGERRADIALARSIMIEVGLVLVVFALVAAWRSSPPPRALAIEAARPVAVHLHTTKAMADVTFTPARAGPTQVAIVVMTGDFGGLDAKEITLSLRNRSLDVEPIARAAIKGPDAIWRIYDFSIPARGRWEMQIEILVTDFDKISLDGPVDFK